MNNLPLPDTHALAISQQLVTFLQQRLQAAGGWIPFSDYMQQALYAPGLGYYAAGCPKLGRQGDFMTAPEFSSLFGVTLAEQVAELLPQTSGVVYEFGAGSGKMAADLLNALNQRNAAPERYVIIDIAADLVDRQKAYLTQAGVINQVTWLNTLPDTVDGVVIGNELLDAMPCELISWYPEPKQRGVGWQQGQFVWEDRPIQDPLLWELVQQLPINSNDYCSEISLTNRGFIRTLAQRLERGAILLIDYGFPEREYYHPQRSNGTLIGHYQHHTIHNPFYLPGLVDLTCHVDFTAIAQSGISAGLDLIGYTSQAMFLMNLGITEKLAALSTAPQASYLAHSNAVQRLLSPAEMGELFKVIGFGKNIAIDWQGFAQGDRCYTL